MKIEETTFENSYDDTLVMLERRSTLEGFDLKDLQGELNTLYIYEGQDWVGRGELKNAEIHGEISAYHVFIEQYKKTQS
jgi:1,4-alpha-glucan branching enzyme